MEEAKCHPELLVRDFDTAQYVYFLGNYQSGDHGDDIIISYWAQKYGVRRHTWACLAENKQEFPSAPMVEWNAMSLSTLAAQIVEGSPVLALHHLHDQGLEEAACIVKAGRIQGETKVQAMKVQEMCSGKSAAKTLKALESGDTGEGNCEWKGGDKGEGKGVQAEVALQNLEDERWETAQQLYKLEQQQANQLEGRQRPPQPKMAMAMRADAKWTTDKVFARAFTFMQQLMPTTANGGAHFAVLAEPAVEPSAHGATIATAGPESVEIRPQFCPVGDSTKRSSSKRRSSTNCFGFEAMQSIMSLAELYGESSTAAAPATAAVPATATAPATAAAPVAAPADGGDDFFIAAAEKYLVNPIVLGQFFAEHVDPTEPLVIGWAKSMPLFPFSDDWYQCSPPAGDGAFLFQKGLFVFTKAAMSLYMRTIVAAASEYAYLKLSGCISKAKRWKMTQTFTEGQSCPADVLQRFKSCSKLLGDSLGAGDNAEELTARLAKGPTCTFTGGGFCLANGIAKFEANQAGLQAQYVYAAVEMDRGECPDGGTDVDDAEMLSYWAHKNRVKPASWVCISKDHTIFPQRPMLQTYGESGSEIARALEHSSTLVALGDMPPGDLGLAACMLKKAAENKGVAHELMRACK
jgi:hypothetical protein